MAAEAHVGHHAQDVALLLVVVGGLVLVPRLLDVGARPAVTSFVGVMSFPS